MVGNTTKSMMMGHVACGWEMRITKLKNLCILLRVTIKESHIVVGLMTNY